MKELVPKLTDKTKLISDSVDQTYETLVFPEAAQVPLEPTKQWWEKGRLTFYKFCELEEYLKDNCFILSGCKVVLTKDRQRYTYKESFISLFHLHNESVNIWSHLLSFAAFIVVFAYTCLATLNPRATIYDKLVFLVMLATATNMFICSSLYDFLNKGTICIIASRSKPACFTDVSTTPQYLY
jgi:Haemolysin-III related